MNIFISGFMYTELDYMQDLTLWSVHLIYIGKCTTRMKRCSIIQNTKLSSHFFLSLLSLL